jgi:hypothetical protein
MIKPRGQSESGRVPAKALGRDGQDGTWFPDLDLARLAAGIRLGGR